MQATSSTEQQYRATTTVRATAANTKRAAGHSATPTNTDKVAKGIKVLNQNDYEEHRCATWQIDEIEMLRRTTMMAIITTSRLNK